MAPQAPRFYLIAPRWRAFMPDNPPVSTNEMATLVQRVGVQGADSVFVARATELAAVTQAQTARLPVLGKDAEPAHVFTVPLR